MKNISKSSFYLWGRRILIGILLVVLVGGVRTWWVLGQASRVGHADLEAAHAETDAFDPGWRWDDMEAERAANAVEGENAFDVLMPVHDQFQKLKLRQFTCLPDGQEIFQDLESNRQLEPVRRDHLGRIFVGRDELFDAAHSLADRPHGHYTLTLTPDVLSTLLPHVEACREIVWLLEMDSELALEQGRADDAARNVRATLNSGAALRHDGMMISQLVRIAIRAVAVRRIERLLGHCEADEATLRDLQARLEAEAKERPILVGLRGERAAHTVLFENLRSGTVPLAHFLENAGNNGNKEPGWSLQVGAWYYSYSLAGDQADYLRWMNRIQEIVRLPSEQQLPLLTALDQEVKTARRAASGGRRGILTFLLMPSLTRVCEGGLRDQAHLATACVALATEGFRRDRKRWPTNLDEVVPNYLPALPADPYTGKCLLYKRLPDGVAIYSVGRNGRDDGGIKLAQQFAMDDDADVGLRLWNPNQRRLPFLVKPEPILEPPTPVNEKED